MINTPFQIYSAVECRLYNQRSKYHVKCLNYGDNHLAKDCPKPKKTSREPFSNSKQNPSTHVTFSRNAHNPLECGRTWVNI